MHNNSKPYYVLSKEFNEDSLKDYASMMIDNNSILDWEKEIYTFILEWFNKEDHIIVHTSGSTGKPKTISLKKEYMIASAKATIEFLKLNKGDKILLCLPANYIAGKMMIVRALYGELQLHYIKPRLIPKFENKLKYDLIALVPSMLSGILKYDKEKQLEDFKNIILGGSEISRTDEEKLANLKNNIWHTYGMTETITHIAMRKVNGLDKSAWFTPLKGVKVNKTKDETLSIECSYLGITNLITNDSIELNDDGYFRILGRRDNVIISGGVKIQAEDLENKISGIIGSNYIIHGIKDDILGQKVVLYIEEPTYINQQEIFSNLSNLLPNINVPKEIIRVDKFDRTQSGKIIRKNYSS